MTSKIEIATRDGRAPAWFFAATRPSNSGIIIYMDVFGIRPALFQIAEKMSDLGHNVLLPDLYYRLGSYRSCSAAEALSSPSLLAHARGMRDRTSPSLTADDTRFFVGAIKELGAFGKVGTVGYCMGGGRALRAAGVLPGQIVAAASIHGGNLAVDDHESPHRYVRDTKARLYIGSAGIDSSFSPAQAAVLAESLRSAEIDHQIENYVGCEHGWAIPDNPIFHNHGSERHWKRLTTLFEEMLR
jgi:carboxymethylenebutenolidase